jgi:predicted alpha-1,2-mannosidase
MKKIIILPFILLMILGCHAPQEKSIQPYTGNHSYWQYHGEPVLLLGASDNDNLFQSANMREQLETLASVGGDFIRNTMSSRDEGDIWAFHKNEAGLYDLEQWNQRYWEKFDSLLSIAEENDIIVQLEVWDRFDYSRDNWPNNPYNPEYNVNYTFAETGFAKEYPDHPYKDLQPFFHTIEGMEHYTPQLEIVKKYQEKYVAELLSISLQYPNVLYCMNNETDTPPAWGKYWIKFIQERAAEAGKTVYTTDMFDGIFRPQSSDDLQLVMSEPETYTFMDISQINSRNLNQVQWDSLMWIMEESEKYKTRPINCTKVYGGPKNRDIFGSVKDGVEKFLRDLMGGCAAVRFHRPTSGNGLSDISQNVIKAVRKVETRIKFWEISPAMEFLGQRSSDEAYLATEPGNKYLIYFPDTGDITLDLSDWDKNFHLQWLDIQEGKWGKTKEIQGGKIVNIVNPNKGDWFAVITAGAPKNVSENELEEGDKLVEYVNPFIGTQNGGNQIPGPKAPFGMIHPSLINNGKDSPPPTNYIYGKDKLYGIALTNLSGVGCSSFGSVVVMPTTGAADFADIEANYYDETAEVGYNSFVIDDNIEVEITATERSAILRFHYPKGKGNLLIDLSRRTELDSSFMIQKISDNEFQGYKTDGRFCAAGENILHKIYFYGKLSKPARETGLKDGSAGLNTNVKTAKGEEIGTFFSYNFEKSQTLKLKVAISYVSMENAKMNLKQEIGDKSFEVVQNETAKKWEKLLSRIRVKGRNEKYKEMFYTAIYHTMSHPNLLNDINGEYPIMDGSEIGKVGKGENRYTVFSLWDTYRTLHPFMTLVYPEYQEQMCRSMMDMYRESGWLPQWELISRETHVMVGDPASIVLSDTYLKGIKYDDPEEIFRAMAHNAEEYYVYDQWDTGTKHIRRGIIPYNKYEGWIPYDYRHGNNRIWGTVATTQEYNIADWNIAQMAKQLDKDSAYQKYLKRSKGYKNLYDPETMFFRQRWADGKWVEPFDPLAKYNEMPWKYSGGPGYVEGHAWHYNFFIPHDIPGLIKLMGGEEKFVNRLRKIFDDSLYNATNEPNIAFPFLFNYVKGEEWRTQETVRNLIDNEFGIGPKGIPGNDDTGTMSAWLIFAMMGFYPDCPGDLDYQICQPVFDKVTIELNNDYYEGCQFVIDNNLKESSNKYIKQLKLNGKSHEKFTINHKKIVNGHTMTIE